MTDSTDDTTSDFPRNGNAHDLLPLGIKRHLLINGRLNAAERIAQDGDTIDFFPVVKLFTPDASFTWLLTEIDPENQDVAFGLCDLGMGCPELGSVSLAEIAALRRPTRPSGGARSRLRSRQVSDRLRRRSPSARPYQDVGRHRLRT